MENLKYETANNIDNILKNLVLKIVILHYFPLFLFIPLLPWWIESEKVSSYSSLLK